MGAMLSWHRNSPCQHPLCTNRPMRAGNDAENASPMLGLVKGTNGSPTAATPQPPSSTAIPSTTPLSPLTVCTITPTASAPIASLTPVAFSGATPSLPGAAAPTTPYAFPLAATTPGLQHPLPTTGLGGRSLATFSDLAAKASALALAAALNNLKLDTELKASAVKAAPASILKARGLAGVAAAAGGAAANAAEVRGALKGCGMKGSLLSSPDASEEQEEEVEEQEANEHQQQQQAEAESGKSVPATGQESAIMTTGHARDAFGRNAQDSGAATSAMEGGGHARTPAGSSGAAAGEDREEHPIRRLAFDASSPAAITPCPGAAPAAPLTPEASPAASSSSSGSALAPFTQAPVPTDATPAWDLDQIAACSGERPWALHVTGRTPLRTQRQTGLLGPGPGASFGHADAGTAGAGAAGAPTPSRASVLRTPARRVAADGVDVEAQAAEAWVEERLVVPGDRVLAEGAWWC